jgi:glycosyl transferase, family 25
VGAMSLIPIFVINLDRATDRLSRVTARFDGLGLGFERVRALEPSDLSQDEMMRLNSPRWQGGETSGVEIACVASHLHVFQMIVDRGLPVACVMEDDALVGEEALNWLKPSMPPGVHILKLEGVGRGPKTKVQSMGDRDGRQIVFSSLISVGSACYLITLEGAKKALEKIPGLNGAIDSRLAKYWMTGINICEVHPFPVRQDGSASSIMDEHLRVARIRNRKTFFRTIKKRIDGRASRAGRVLFQVRTLGWKFFDRVTVTAT